jgi:23S rRNA (cytidine1920-2'-O)/16S rRNA (cytidine1409-2'-O)-methyltransferase
MPVLPRLDELLVLQGYYANQDEAARACLAGSVRAAGRLLAHPGERLAEGTPLEVALPAKYVSRGGEKLAGALRHFALDPSGLRCIDVGASTGGFTDCLLKAHASMVAAVDVGYGQFAYSLRKDNRVRLFERTNISKASPAELGAPFALIVADVSFSPLARLLPVFEGLAEEGSELIALCKPQFELPKALVGSGVVREKPAHTQALEAVLGGLEKTAWGARGLTHSPLRGAKGNIEFFLWATFGASTATINVEEVVEEAHRSL